MSLAKVSFDVLMLIASANIVCRKDKEIIKASNDSATYSSTLWYMLRAHIRYSLPYFVSGPLIHPHRMCQVVSFACGRIAGELRVCFSIHRTLNIEMHNASRTAKACPAS